MKILKKILLLTLTFGLLFSAAQAKTSKSSSGINDVSKDYWAYTEIASVIRDDVMTTTAGYFNPEDSLTRADFVKALLKTLGHDDLVIKVKNTFSDITVTSPSYYDVLKSKQLGLVYGYTDGTFKPERYMTKAEVASVISHITKDTQKDLSILDQFSDAADIPSWCKHQYAKTIKYGIYVNHPDENALESTREITRAEAAVILYKLKASLGLVKEEYKPATGAETVLGTEHLDVSSKAEVDTVIITSTRKIIEAGNVLAVKFDELFKSKNAGEGDVVSFVFDKDVYTKEGTLVIPEGSKLYATVTEIIPTKWFNKNARVGLLFNKLQLADGRIMSFNGVPATRDNYLKEGPWETAGKLTAYTVGGAALGTGVGLATGLPNHRKYLDRGLGIGIPVGAGVGLATGLITKGLNFVGHEGDKVYVKLLSDVSVYN